MYYILAAIFLWSSLGIIIRFSGMPVQVLIFFSCVISVFFTGPIFFLKKYRKEIPSIRGFFYLFIIGPISLLNTFSFYYAYEKTSIANAVLTHYTAPVIVALLAPVFLKEKLTVRVLLSIAAATIGLWIMFGVYPVHLYRLMIAGDKETAGIVAGLISGFFYGMLIIMFRIYVRDFSPLVLVFFQNFIIAAILLPFITLPADFTSAIWAFAIMGLVHSIIAPFLYFRGIKDVTANMAAILGYLEPVCAIMLGILFLGENITYSTMIGGTIVLFSGYMTIKK